jgi:hypothetical protein
VVARYADDIYTWSVIKGLNVFNDFGFNFEQVLEMTRAANMAVKAASDRAFKIIEISNPWGEYYATKTDTIPPLVYMDMVVQSGINFDAFGLAMQFGKNQSGMHIRDMMQISAGVAGVWHKEWDQTGQGEWIEQFCKIALSKQFVDTVAYSRLCDTEDSTIANSGLLTGRLEPKKSFQTLKKLHDSIFNR